MPRFPNYEKDEPVKLTLVLQTGDQTSLRIAQNETGLKTKAKTMRYAIRFLDYFLRQKRLMGDDWTLCWVKDGHAKPAKIPDPP